MKYWVEKLLILLIILAAGLTGYFAVRYNPWESYTFTLVFLILFMVYHILADIPIRKLFLRVLLIFATSTFINVVNYYANLREAFWIYLIEFLLVIGYLIILSEVLSHHKVMIKFKFNFWSVLSLAVLIIDLIVIRKIVLLLDQFQLGWNHMLFGFFFTIVKMIILSIGLIYYFLSFHKSKKTPFLIGALALFFVSDLVDTVNYLFFFKDPIQAGLLLRSGFWLIGIFMFYVYCTYPQHDVEPTSKLYE